MRKEILFAIIAGVFLGLIVAFGVWRANSVLKPKDLASQSNSLDTAATETPSEFGLSISEPEEKDVFTDANIKVIGLSKPGVWIVISGGEDDYITKTDSTGKFEQEIELNGGINQLNITALDEGGVTTVKKVTVVYSSEFNKEVSDTATNSIADS